MFQSAESARNELVDLINLPGFPEVIKSELQFALAHYDQFGYWEELTALSRVYAEVYMPASVIKFIDESPEVFSVWHKDFLEYLPLEKIPNIYRMHQSHYLTIAACDHKGCINLKLYGTVTEAKFMAMIRHELCHVAQIKSGRLQIDPVTSICTWEGVEYNNVTPENDMEGYLALPWEVEAYAVSDPRNFI